MTHRCCACMYATRKTVVVILSQVATVTVFTTASEEVIWNAVMAGEAGYVASVC